MKKTGAVFASIMALGLFWVVSAEAGQFRLGHRYADEAANYDTSQYQDGSDGYGDESGFAVSPSQAASIAKRSWPGSKVLRVQLLPSGIYAVTLKQGGEVSRVLIDASSGSIV